MSLYVGIILGLLAAATQSVSYLLAKSFTTGRKGGRRRLLIASHIFIGIVCAAVIPLLWPKKVDSHYFLWPAFISTVTYLFAQAMMFVALHSTDASRVSPLLAGKIVIIALIMFFMGKTDLGLMHCIAIGLTIIAAACINHAGGSIPVKALLAVAAACLGYSLSDINIYELMQCLEGFSRMRATLLGVSLTYLFAGMICLPFGIFAWKQTLADLKHVSAFSITWTLAMLFLFSCFGLIGPIYGNILQSTRGIISIVIGAAIAKMGHDHLEQKVSRKVFVARIIAAVILVLAIGLYQRADKKKMDTAPDKIPASEMAEAPAK